MKELIRQKCEICLDDHNNPDDRIAICKSCGIAVHQACYGGDILEYMPEDEWVCEACHYLTIRGHEDLKCVFCPIRKHGTLKHIAVINGNRDDFWAHVQCVNWIPEIRFTNEEYFFSLTKYPKK